PFVFDVFEDDGRIEEPDAFVDQGRHFAARIGLQEFTVRLAGADRDRHLGLVLHALLIERDLDLLRIRRKWMLVDDHGHFLSFHNCAIHPKSVAASLGTLSSPNSRYSVATFTAMRSASPQPLKSSSAIERAASKAPSPAARRFFSSSRI